MKNAFTESERKAIGEWIKNKRNNLSMKQTDLAEKLGCGRTLISDIERGKCLTKIQFLACCRVLCVENSERFLHTIREQINNS